MSKHRAPQQWRLTRVETITSYESWRQNLIYTLALDPNFAPFLLEGVTWQKLGADPHRGLVSDADPVPEAERKTAQQKVVQLELMLGQIANFCSVITRPIITERSASLSEIWQQIRLHFGFQSSGSHFLEFSDIHLEAEERPEDLYQRLLAFVEDNLIKKDGMITHHGEKPTSDEQMSPTLENMVVLTWLRLIHKDLPTLIRQRYGTELRSRSLASIKPEISQALDSLVEEVQNKQDAKVMRSAGFNSKPTGQSTRYQRSPQASGYTSKSVQYQRSTKEKQSKRFTKNCPLCKEAGRDPTHFLSECKYLPESDRKYISKARMIHALAAEFESDSSEEEYEAELDDPHRPKSVRRVKIEPSPVLSTFFEHHKLNITIDSGAEANMIKHSVAIGIGAKITKSTQSAHQADGASPLKIVGETKIIITRDSHEFILEALVVQKIDAEILGGTPFMKVNDVAVRPAKQQIILGDGSIYTYGSDHGHPHAGKHTPAHILRVSQATTIWPGDFMELSLPDELKDQSLSVEPRMDTNEIKTDSWLLPSVLEDVGGKIRIPNNTKEPIYLRKHAHVGQVLTMTLPAALSGEKVTPSKLSKCPDGSSYSDPISVNRDKVLSYEMETQFRTLNTKFDNVFNPKIEGYNGASGKFEAVVNMGPVLPPQRKGRVPQYSRDKLVELQQKFDDLEAEGVFKRPEDINTVAEYLNPSFLIKKPSGGFRLVTAFADVGRYCKPQPSLMPDIDSTLRNIARWEYIICTDLTSAFYQIPLSDDSIKYCGVATPFKGVRVYTRCAMGMPGSETALEELMCRILGELIQEGCVAKLADDLYCGGNTPEELLNNWEKVLTAMHANNLKLSHKKTIIAPKQTTILGWIWSSGTIHASPHRISTLANCSLPTTVTNMRSFIGAYKILSRVIPNCSDHTGPLEQAIAGLESKDKVSWTDPLREAFNNSQKALSSNKTIVLPNPNDQLWIVTDGAVKTHGLGATLYVSRKGKPRLAGFYSAKLQKRQVTWIPCEIEALCISAAVKHFSPYIIQSKHNTCILTDSKPCVQAHEKLCRGEFSSSARVATFLSSISRYQVSVRHLSGAANLPSDFASRNAPECETSNCQICSFINQSEQCTVLQTSVNDVVTGTARLPFTSRPAWIVTQSECADLRRVKAHLKQGTRPTKKSTDIKDVKRYLNVASIARDGLLVVPRVEPLVKSTECIIVPRSVLPGLLTALHLKLDHPSANQLKLVCRRYLYALDMDKGIDSTTKSCHQCASLKQSPPPVLEQTTSDPPESIGVTFAADVLKRERQLIFVLRENITSVTGAVIIENEQAQSLREAIIRLCVEIRPLDGPHTVVRVDPAPGFVALRNDVSLHNHRIGLEIGRVKNPNKNPIAERAIQEIEEEILRQDPTGGPVSLLGLSLVVARLNSRIRKQGLSSREMWTQRDQFTNSQLPISDRQLIQTKYDMRVTNHPYSEQSKSRSQPVNAVDTITVSVGDLVYLHADRNKTLARPRYLVVSSDQDWCNIRKFAGSQLRSASYKVKQCECFRVPSDTNVTSQLSMHADLCSRDQTAEAEDVTHNHPTPQPPSIPQELSDPPEQPVSHTPSIPQELSNPPEQPVSDLPVEIHNNPSGPEWIPPTIQSPELSPISVQCPERDRPCVSTPKECLNPTVAPRNRASDQVTQRPSRTKTVPKKFDGFKMYK